YTCNDSVKLFESTGVMNKAELAARTEIKWEIYTKKIQIEARIFGDMAINHIIPVATSYQSNLIDNVYKMKGILGDEADELASTNIELIKKIAKHVKAIEEGVNQLVEARKVANVLEDEYEKAMAYYKTVVPKMEEIRHDIDKLEEVVDDNLWPLPKYRELLFVC
ncbi:MAG: glutamine synthetase type III, partial [Bacteroidales bacterium]|nr:glutamine synthetase type III [Bacteroidales bacterium]